MKPHLINRKIDILIAFACLIVLIPLYSQADEQISLEEYYQMLDNPTSVSGQIKLLKKHLARHYASNPYVPTRALCYDYNNQFVSITVSSVGNFGMGTKAGDPNDPSDNNKKLIFSWPNCSNTTYSTLWVDNSAVVYGEVLQGGVITKQPTVYPFKAEINMTWLQSGISCVQNIRIISSLNRRADTAEITYYLTNTTNFTKQVGFRILLDTQIGDNDGAFINVVGFPQSQFEREFFALNMPQYWQAYEGSPGSPGLTAQGTLVGANATPPDRFAVCDWTLIAGLNQHIWDYAINPAEDYTNDSSVVMWWFPKAVSPGETLRYTTYYGLGTGSRCEDDLSVNFSAPSTLAVVNCQYSPNPFQALLNVQNISPLVAQNARATLTLPTGLQFVPPSAGNVPLGNLQPQQQVQHSWEILADGTVTGILTMHLEVTSDTTATCEIDRDIEIPIIDCTSTPTATHTPVATSTPTPTLAPTWTPTVTASPTSTMTPTMTPTFTPYYSPTPTATPDRVPPIIRAGGYGTTDLMAYTTGRLEMYAWIDTQSANDDDRVEIKYQGTTIGIMRDDGTYGDYAADDGVYYFSKMIGDNMPPGRFLMEMVAYDYAGNASKVWPYFNIYPDSGPAPAPDVPHYEIDMLNFITGKDRLLEETPYRRSAAAGSRPYIFVGGYMNTHVTTLQGGEFNLIGIPVDYDNDVSILEMFYNSVTTGVQLRDDGSSGDFAYNDGVYGLFLHLTPPLNQINNVVLEIAGYDYQGNRSDLWPYLTIHAPTPTPTPVPTDTPTSTPTPYPTPCFDVSPPDIQVVGEPITTDGSCTVVWGGRYMLYSYDWGDGSTPTAFSTNPTGYHIYIRSKLDPYIITLTTRTESGIETSTTRDIFIAP